MAATDDLSRRPSSLIVASEVDDVFELGNIVSTVNIEDADQSSKPKSILKRNSSYSSFHSFVSSMGSIDASQGALSVKSNNAGNNGDRRKIMNCPSYASENDPSINSPISDTLSKSRTMTRVSSTVSFQSVDVREYDQTLGDNPSCMSGAPISLDWSYSETTPMPVEDYEKAFRNKPNRLKNSCRMSKRSRENVLRMKLGYSEEELKAAKKEKKKVQRARSVSSFTSNFWRVEDAWQSLGRKLGSKRKDKSKSRLDDLDVSTINTSTSLSGKTI